MRKNVIIFIVDSVRHYSSGGLDDRDKLEMMDEFEKESIYFPLAVSSAPSSIMSLSSMLTSLPAYYIARNYDDFKYDNNQFISLPTILKNNGYDMRSIFNARELRFLFGDVIEHVDKKYWPDEINNNQANWSNEQMNIILENFLNSNEMGEPFFLLAWYNVREDPNTSQHISRGIEILKEKKIWNNSVFLLGADHGYMDPRRGYTPEKLRKMGLSHDLLMSDDNIRIPFYLRYPKSIPKKIEQQVSTLDFLPTILSLLNIEYPKSKTYNMQGDDLLPLINKETEALDKFSDRFVRSDARFFAQKNRATAIRNGRYKYVIRPDQKIEEFYDIDEDLWEDNNIIFDDRHKSLVKKFRDYYEQSEKGIIDFQFKYLLGKIPDTLKVHESTKILVVGFGEPHYLSNLFKIFREFWQNVNNIDVLISEKLHKGIKGLNNYNEIFTDNNSSDKISSEKILNMKYDLLIIFSDSYNKDNLSKFNLTLAKSIKYDKKFLIDPNMDLVSRKKVLLNPKMMINVFMKKRKYYTENPKMIFNHFKKLMRIIFKEK